MLTVDALEILQSLGPPMTPMEASETRHPAEVQHSPQSTEEAMTTQSGSPVGGITQTWTGTMELANNTNYAITNVAYQHYCESVPTVTGHAETLENNGDAPACNFTTAKGKSDYWFISFLDESNNLITGQLQQDFHESSANSMVEISLLPTTFSVTISGTAHPATYDQKKV